MTHIFASQESDYFRSSSFLSYVSMVTHFNLTYCNLQCGFKPLITVSDLVRTLYSVPTGSQTMCLWYYVLNGPSAEFWVTQTKPISHLNVWPYSTILLRCPPADLTKMRRRAFYLCPSLILVINHVRVTNKFETMCSTHVISYD